MNRREFLQHTGAACVAVGVGACGDDPGCDTAELISANASEGLARVPSSAIESGSVRVQVEGHKILLARLDSGEVAGVSWVCPHAGCTVCFEDGAQEFNCPCHGARFATDGRVTKGPAREALREYPVSEAGGQLTIELTETP